MKAGFKRSLAGLLGAIGLVFAFSGSANAALQWDFGTCAIGSGTICTYTHTISNSGTGNWDELTLSVSGNAVVKVELAPITVNWDLLTLTSFDGSPSTTDVSALAATYPSDLTGLAVDITFGPGSHVIRVNRERCSGQGCNVDATYQLQVSTVRISEAPIPAAALLFGSGLGFLGLVGRRRRKSAA